MRALFPLLLLALASCQTLSPSTNELVVLSYNIHHGQGTDGVFDLPRIAQVIIDSGADLVALQEVDMKTGRASGVNQAKELARLTGMNYAFGKAIDFSGGEYGDAVLSRFPIQSAKRIELPAEPHHEKRVAVAVRVKLPGSSQEIRFVSTHLDHTKDPADRIAQALELRDQLRPAFLTTSGGSIYRPAPSGSLPATRPITILVGDLNAQPDSAPISILLEDMSSAAPMGMPTFPSDEPSIQIDWIMLSAEHNWEVLEVEVLYEKVASDHRPLRASLILHY